MTIERAGDRHHTHESERCLRFHQNVQRSQQPHTIEMKTEKDKKKVFELESPQIQFSEMI